MLLSVTNLVSYFPSLIVLITQFRLHEITFPSLYRAVFLISSFLQFSHLHLISLFVLSLFCRISSHCTNRTQSIHPLPYLVPLLWTSISTTTLDSDPPISQRYYPYTSTLPPSFILYLLILSTLLARVQFH